jgi:hypothetical protein
MLRFQVRLRIREKRLLASQVRLSARISAVNPTGRISVKLWAFTKICPETPNLVKIGQKYRTLYIKTSNIFCCWRHTFSTKAFL